MAARIHRIGVVVEDLDQAVELFTKMFGGSFTRTGEAVSEEAGVEVAADWELGIELVRPVPGSDNPIARQMERFLERTGGGIFGAGFTVADMDTALAGAESAGVPALLPTFRFSPEQLDEEFNGAFTRFEETVLDTYGRTGAAFAFNRIEDARSEET